MSEEELRERWQRAGMPEGRVLMERIADLEAQCAAMNEALEDISGKLPCDMPCVWEERFECPTCQARNGPGWCAGCRARRALAPAAGKALLERLERLEHHRKTATEYLSALEECKGRLAKAEAIANLNTAMVDAELERIDESLGKHVTEARTQAFEECAKLIETEDLWSRYDQAAAIRAKALEGT